MKRPLAEASANADAGGGTRGGKAQQVDWRTVHSRTLARMCAAQRLQVRRSRHEQFQFRWRAFFARGRCVEGAGEGERMEGFGVATGPFAGDECA